jgi:hypothetical protein
MPHDVFSSNFQPRISGVWAAFVLPLLLSCSGVALAQVPAPQRPVVAPVAPVAPLAAPQAVERSVNPGDKQIEQKVEQIHHEDAGSRVDELRVGGQTKSITVQPKTGNVPQYHITPSVGARQQPSQRDGVEADGTQRTWRVLGF